MLPVLGREVVEGQQCRAILGQAIDRLVIFDGVGLPRQALAFGAAIVEKRATGEELAAELWIEYLGQEMECFACGAAVATPPAPFTMVLPDKLPAPMLAAPLCATCAALAPMVRVARCLKMLRKMKIRR
jgi:hypothetical protein